MLPPPVRMPAWKWRYAFAEGLALLFKKDCCSFSLNWSKASQGIQHKGCQNTTTVTVAYAH
eukprot:1414503-Alexandrium_andersonii.AAC.1